MWLIPIDYDAIDDFRGNVTVGCEAYAADTIVIRVVIAEVADAS